MVSITIGKKIWVLKRTLLREEVKYILENSAYIATFQSTVEKGDIKEIQKLSNDIATMGPDVQKFVDKCVSECFGLTLKQLDKMENTEILMMQSELYQVSTVLKKT